MTNLFFIGNAVKSDNLADRDAFLDELVHYGLGTKGHCLDQGAEDLAAVVPRVKPMMVPFSVWSAKEVRWSFR